MQSNPSTSPAEQAPSTKPTARCIGIVADSTKPRARGAHYAGAKPTPEQLDQLYNVQLLPSSEIARQYGGVTRKTVTNWLEQADIPRRRGKEAAVLRFLAQSEFVPPEEREDCLLDRAWEARPERRIRNKVVCRLCFRQVSRLTGKTAHLSTCHEGMTGEDYARVMPGHSHDCFQHSADSNGLEVEKLMDNWCTEWATADEIRNWRRDPKLAQAKEYVGCLECGRKLFSGAEIQRHAWKIHDWTLEQYRERYPGAPTGSLDRRAMQADKSTKRWHELKQLRALVIAQQAQQQPAPKRRGRGLEKGATLKDTKARITIAASFGPGPTPPSKIAPHLYPNQGLKANALHSAVVFLGRHREKIEHENARLAGLSATQREVEIQAADQRLKTA